MKGIRKYYLRYQAYSCRIPSERLFRESISLQSLREAIPLFPQQPSAYNKQRQRSRHFFCKKINDSNIIDKTSLPHFRKNESLCRGESSLVTHGECSRRAEYSGAVFARRVFGAIHARDLSSLHGCRLRTHVHQLRAKP